MRQDVHERARQLIACNGPTARTGATDQWLAEHLEDCAACRRYAEEVQGMVSSLRSLPIVANPALVRNTQLQVCLRAAQLQQKRERLLLAWVCCTMVALFTAATLAVLWPGVEWLRDRLQVSSLTLQITYVVFWMAPAITSSILLFARGIHLGLRNGSSHQT